jgi:hypothetical protein
MGRRLSHWITKRSRSGFRQCVKLERGAARGQDIIGRQCEALEPGVDALVVPDPNMNLAALQQRHLIQAKSFRQLHAHAGEAFGISRQKSRQDAFDCLRRRGQLQHAGVSALEQLYPFAKRAHLTQYPAAISEQVLTSGSQEEAATDTVKKLEPAFIFFRLPT